MGLGSDYKLVDAYAKPDPESEDGSVPSGVFKTISAGIPFCVCDVLQSRNVFGSTSPDLLECVRSYERRQWRNDCSDTRSL